MFIVDGSSFLYRAFFALPMLTTKSGFPTNATYGFTRMILKIIKEFNPEYMTVVFDKGKSAVRLEVYKEYKATRPSMPSDLRVQIPYVKSIVKALGIPIIELENVEADDLIGTIANKISKEGIPVVVVSPDKDMLQIVRDNIKVYDPIKDVFYDRRKVIERFQVEPEKLPFYFALIGDKSDNIPGVKGIGERLARELVAKFEDLDDLYKRLASLPSSVAVKLVSGKESAYKSKLLFQIKTDVNIDVSIDSFKRKEPDFTSLRKIYTELEFKSLLRELPVEVGMSDQAEGSVSTFQVERKCCDEKVFVFRDGEKFLVLSDELKEVVDVNDILNILDNSVHIVSYNLKDVIKYLMNAGKYVDVKGDDLMIMSYLINPLRKPPLSFKEFFVQQAKRELSKENFRQVRALFNELLDKIPERGLSFVYREIELPLVPVIAKMELRGVKVDEEKLRAFKSFLDTRIKELSEKIYGECGVRFNINSPSQLAEVLFGKLKLKPVKKTKSGFSTDIEVLEKLKDQHPVISLLIEYRQLVKLRSTYVVALINLIDRKTGRVHTTYNQIGTVTGRISSSEPNLQNIPIKGEYGKLLREAFVADNGYLLVSFDYSQIELRVLAELSKDKALVEAFKRGEDIHLYTAMRIFGVDRESVDADMRRKAKVVNFGIIYGMSPHGLSKELSVSEEDASRFIKEYFEKYQGVREFIEKTISEAKSLGFVKTYFGRIRPVPEFYSPKREERELAKRIAINTPIQGTSADIIKLAMISIDREIVKKGWDAHMILQIHDELVFEVREDQVDEFISTVRVLMENVVPDFIVPLKVETYVGKNWSKGE